MRFSPEPPPVGCIFSGACRDRVRKLVRRALGWDGVLTWSSFGITGVPRHVFVHKAKLSPPENVGGEIAACVPESTRDRHSRVSSRNKSNFDGALRVACKNTHACIFFFLLVTISRDCYFFWATRLEWDW